MIPAFGKRIISEIGTKDIIAWQNELLAYRDKNKKPYANTYLKSIHNPKSITGDAIHTLLLDCNESEKKMLTKTLAFMKALFSEFGV